jgi:hypothetical protein
MQAFTSPGQKFGHAGVVRQRLDQLDLATRGRQKGHANLLGWLLGDVGQGQTDSVPVNGQGLLDVFDYDSDVVNLGSHI